MIFPKIKFKFQLKELKKLIYILLFYHKFRQYYIKINKSVIFFLLQIT